MKPHLATQFRIVEQMQLLPLPPAKDRCSKVPLIVRRNSAGTFEGSKQDLACMIMLLQSAYRDLCSLTRTPPTLHERECWKFNRRTDGGMMIWPPFECPTRNSTAVVSESFSSRLGHAPQPRLHCLKGSSKFRSSVGATGRQINCAPVAVRFILFLSSLETSLEAD